jgi:hypothetical protein
MTKTTLLGLLALGGLATLVSCDNGQDGTTAALGPNDCPYGTFRPAGLSECVFPSSDLNNFPIGVSDNRCAFGQPAIPPQCVSDSGERAYLSVSSKCAPNYRWEPGACNRGGGVAGITGAAGFIGGTAGFFGGDAGSGFNTGTAGAIVGAAGSGVLDGAAGSVGTGAGGDSTGTAGAGAAGATGAGTGSGGAG